MFCFIVVVLEFLSIFFDWAALVCVRVRMCMRACACVCVCVRACAKEQSHDHSVANVLLLYPGFTFGNNDEIKSDRLVLNVLF